MAGRHDFDDGFRICDSDAVSVRGDCACCAGGGAAMNALYVVGGLLAAVLFVYLAYALWRPEKF